MTINPAHNRLPPEVQKRRRDRPGSPERFSFRGLAFGAGAPSHAGLGPEVMNKNAVLDFDMMALFGVG
jgi:hypothetical protein